MEDVHLKLKDVIIKSNKEVRPHCSSFLFMAFALQVLDVESGKLLNYRQMRQHPKYKEEWDLSAANEFGWLAQGIDGRVKGTERTFFIQKSMSLPTDSKITLMENLSARYGQGMARNINSRHFICKNIIQWNGCEELLPHDSNEAPQMCIWNSLILHMK